MKALTQKLRGSVDTINNVAKWLPAIIAIATGLIAFINVIKDAIDNLNVDNA